MLIRIPRPHNGPLLADIAMALPSGVRFVETSGVKATERSYTFRGVLRCDTGRNRYARRAASGRRTNGANWETHRVFLSALFDAWPEATVKTALATYRGRADFQARVWDTAYVLVPVPGDPDAIVPFSIL